MTNIGPVRLALAIICLAHSPAAAQQPASFDVVIAGGRILDGSGNPAFRGDVGITGDRITAVGDLSKAIARRRIDASGKLITPGFIDIHSHAYDPSGPNGTRIARDDRPERLAAPNLVTQGITTTVINQDGRSPLSIAGQRLHLTKVGTGTNILLLVGHGRVRSTVMGDDHKRPARPDEVARMRALVRDGMKAGAFGLSAGLEYIPGRWSETSEIVELAKEVAPYRGVYISHERSEGSDPMWFWPSKDAAGPPTLIDAVKETITVGEQSGAVVVASHIKAKGAHFWGNSKQAIDLIEAARIRGVDVYADHYPYETSGTDGNTVLLPPWALTSGGGSGIFAEGNDAGEVDYAARLNATLADKSRVAALRQDIAHEIRRRGGASNLLILDHPDKAQVGKTLADLATARGVDPVDMAILLQQTGDRTRPGGAHLRGFSMSEEDIDRFAGRSWMATATDGIILLPGDEFGVLHPRSYGTFPRKIRRYALDRNALSLEDAVRSATSLPAQILGLSDRGTIRAGAAADIVVMDLAALKDVATAERIHQLSKGVDWVWVNGREVVANGQPTSARPGRVIANPRSSNFR